MEFLALLIALIAILLLRNAGKRIRALEQRATALEQRLGLSPTTDEPDVPLAPSLDTFEPARHAPAARTDWPAAPVHQPGEIEAEASGTAPVQDGAAPPPFTAR